MKTILEAGDTIWLNNLEEAIFITKDFIEEFGGSRQSTYVEQEETWLPPELAVKVLEADELDEFNKHYKLGKYGK